MILVMIMMMMRDDDSDDYDEYICIAWSKYTEKQYSKLVEQTSF